MERGPPPTAQQCDACRLECARLRVQNAELIEEREVLRGQVDRLQNANTCTPQREHGQRPVPLPAWCRLKRLVKQLATNEAALQACLADFGPAVDVEQASEEELREMREIRGRAAAMSIRGMTLMKTYYSALEPSMLTRIHAAAWRPRQAGKKNASADAFVPRIAQLYFRSRLLQFILPVVCCAGLASGMAVLFDCFEAGSWHEWLAGAAAALTLPLNVCNGASLNTKTVRALLNEFQPLYVLFNVVGFTCLFLLLFREHPAKMVAYSLGVPSILLAGFQDAYVEGGRVRNSRIFFTFYVACFLIFLVFVSLKLGALTDYTFQVSAFAFFASSMACSTITTLLVFGCKNLGLSFYRPGSLVVLTSAVCCLFLDADTLAVLKVAYSLHGQSLGKHAPNKTVVRQLKRYSSLIPQSTLKARVFPEAVAPTPESPTKAGYQQAPPPLHAPCSDSFSGEPERGS
jgi:hypothetical protein